MGNDLTLSRARVSVDSSEGELERKAGVGRRKGAFTLPQSMTDPRMSIFLN